MKIKSVISIFYGFLCIFLLTTTSAAQAPTPAPDGSIPAPPEPAAAELFTPNGSTSSSTNLNTGGESKANIGQIVRKAQPTKVTADYMNWSTFNAGDLYSGNGQGLSTNRVGLGYKISETDTIGLKQTVVFNYQFANTGSTGSTGDAHLKDLYFNYSSSKLFTFWNDAKFLDLSTRVYFPTGEESRFVTGTQTGNFNWFLASKPLSAHWNANFHIRTNVWSQSKSAYLNPNGSGNYLATKTYGADLQPEIEYRVNERLAFSHAVGTSNQFYSIDSRVASTQDSTISSWSQVDFQATKNIDLTFAISDEADLTGNSGHSFGMYRNDETVYNLFFIASM